MKYALGVNYVLAIVNFDYICDEMHCFDITGMKSPPIQMTRWLIRTLRTVTMALMILWLINS